MGWTWVCTDASGAVVSGMVAGEPPPSFPTQSDAESWLGESWRALLDSGVENVSLREDDRHIYGPMSLRPVE
jgi:hypothetical protein